MTTLSRRLTVLTGMGTESKYLEVEIDAWQSVCSFYAGRGSPCANRTNVAATGSLLRSMRLLALMIVLAVGKDHARALFSIMHCLLRCCQNFVPEDYVCCCRIIYFLMYISTISHL